MNVLEVNFEKKLKNFPLHIQFQAEGGCIGILGASGCGKSMTFKAIAGIETPDSGKICLGKRELFHRGHKVNLPPRKRSVGYLFQSYALFPNMTVFQNIEAGIQGKKGGEKRAGNGNDGKISSVRAGIRLSRPSFWRTAAESGPGEDTGL